MWQVAIVTTADIEDAVAQLLERQFQKTASIYQDAATGVRNISIYTERLASSPASVRATMRADLKEMRVFGLDTGRARILIKKVPRENWAESWKRHFKPIDIDSALLVKPPWSKVKPKKGQRVIILNPGLSFGTGHHPTTFFCLRQLARVRDQDREQSFLDIGTGSGILAIAAAKLGYKPIEAFDFDPVAVRVSRQNIKRNRVETKVMPTRKDVTKLSQKPRVQFDVVCANLVHDLLISEAEKICARVKRDGTLIVAGILRRHFGAVKKAFGRLGLTCEVSMLDKEWQSGQFVL